jgi:hypothetical protein
MPYNLRERRGGRAVTARQRRTPIHSNVLNPRGRRSRAVNRARGVRGAIRGRGRGAVSISDNETTSVYEPSSRSTSIYNTETRRQIRLQQIEQENAYDPYVANYPAPLPAFSVINEGNVEHVVRQSHMPNVYQLTRNGEPFDAEMEDMGILYRAREDIMPVIRSVQNLNPGYRTGVSLDGFPLGHLVYLLNYYNIPLSGLYLSGRCTEFVNESEALEGHDKTVKRSALNVSIHEFPLEKVRPIFHNEREISAENEPRTLNEYLAEIGDSWGGSDASTYFLTDDCFIARRSFPGAHLYISKFRATKTGGLSNLITEKYEKTFRFNNVDYTVFIPDGSNQCFNQCVMEGYIRNSGGDEAFGLNQEEEIELGWEPPSDRLRRQISIIQNEIFEERLKKNCSRAGTVTQYDRARYRKKIMEGYTSKELSLLGALYRNYNIYIHCYRFMKDGLWDICKVKEKGDMNTISIHCFRMTDLGKIENSDTPVEANSEETSGMRHSILVYPFPALKGAKLQGEFIKALEQVTVTFMNDIYQNTHYCEESEDTMRKQVEFQLERYNRLKTNTLIFHTDTRKAVWKDKIAGVNSYYVFVYDLETVTNKQANQDMVYPPFRRPFISDDIEPMECQIPFSAQWAPVNVSDMGRYAVRKIRENMEPRIDPRPATSYYIEGTSIEFHDILLQEVVTEYGDKQLGRCVDDMFYHIAEWIHERGGSIGFLYAHNGVGFDSYVCLQFTQYQIKSLLKTSRGILSMTVVVPLNSEISISLILRDTKVHIAAPLSKICESFKVPEAWCKLDFPIYKINAFNCYDEKIMNAVLPYQENDVKCLGFIVKHLNEMIMCSEWDPAQCSVRPPITQFMTCMSMVKKSTLSHFLKSESRIYCHAIDIPRLRHWLCEATMGGRVTAYARTYVHKLFPCMMTAREHNDTFQLKKIHEKIISDHSAMQVLDVTSLYPTAQSQCPMPTGQLYFADKQTCIESINAIQCDACESMYSLCSIHKGGQCELRPYIIILVKNCIPGKHTMLNYVGRKLTSDTKSKLGLVYSLESREEINERLEKEVIREIQAYSNVDLYWMKKQGYTFEVINGFGWQVSMTYNSFIEPAFQKRIEAKKKGNKVLSDFYKLNYNSAYGVTAQKDIMENGFIMTLPEELHQKSYEDEEVFRYITTTGGSHGNLSADENLIGNVPLRNGQTYFIKEKKSHLHEFYSHPSPIQIGAAVLSWSRHIMNLIMYGLDVYGEITYTDTDSIAVSDYAVYKHLEKVPGLIDNRFEAALGSLKNDHAEDNGTEPRVVASFIGTKKVKMHITLNAEGELRIFNTFKGLNPSLMVNGEQMHSDYAKSLVAKALIEINEEGKMNDVAVSQWKRTIDFGIEIGEHAQSSHDETYLAHSAGTFHTVNTFKNHLEWFIPHGHRPVEWDTKERKKFMEEKALKRSYDELKDFIVNMYPKRNDKKTIPVEYDNLF